MLNITNATEIGQKKGTYLLYGIPGMGKTSTFKYLPGMTLWLDIDRTSDVLKDCPGIDILKIDNVHTWDDWQNVILELYQNYRR